MRKRALIQGSADRSGGAGLSLRSVRLRRRSGSSRVAHQSEGSAEGGEAAEGM